MSLEYKKGTVTGNGTYEVGTEVILTVTPNAGYEFAKWEDGNKENPRTVVVKPGKSKYVAMYAKIEEHKDKVEEPKVEEKKAHVVIETTEIEETIPETEEIILEETEEKPKKTTTKKKKSE